MHFRQAMSALAGVFGPAAGSSGGALRDMLAAMHHRGSGAAEEFVSPGVRLMATRHQWEESVGGWSGPLIVMDDSWVIAADATLYYVADLRRRLGVATTPANTGELLLLALRKWGAHFARYIEGDYAIIAWERRTGRVLLARDFGGRRNLVYSRTGGSLVVASSPTGAVCHPAVSADYDETFIAIAASAALAHGPRTAYRQVAAVPGGSTLSISGDQVTEVDRWTPPPFDSAWESELSPAGAEELRALLIDATRERIARNGPTAVWMSGGWDSTSVFAAGKSALQRADRGDRSVLIPISLSLPVDDWGYEDDHIRAVAEHWSVPVDWIRIDQIPLMADSERRARVRDDPMVQAFESMLRTLSKRSVELGSRIALEGFGGDHLFLVSGGTILADHLFYGRWSRLWEAWRFLPGGRRQLVRDVLLPHLSPSVRRWIGAVRGRALGGYWDRSKPDWIRSTPLIAAELEPEFERLPGEGAAEFESRWMITNSVVPRAIAWNHALGLDEGVQIRGPLFDQRIISFAASRPLSDRGSGGDSKRILRLAMAGLLPESVLAPRSRKTGTTGGYFRRQLQHSLRSQVTQLFSTGASNLEQMGILDRRAILSAADQYASNADHLLGSWLYSTLETERWLAEHKRPT